MENKTVYFHIRHPEEDPQSVKVYSIANERKGPFYLFPKDARSFEIHKPNFSELADTRLDFVDFNNVKCSIKDSKIYDLYLNKDGNYHWNGVELSDCKSINECHSIIQKTKSLRKNDTRNNQDDNNEILNSTTFPNPNRIESNTSNKRPLNNFVLPPIGKLPKPQNAPSNINEFTVRKVCDTVKQIKKDGLAIFDPIRMDVRIWFGHLEKLIDKYECSFLIDSIIISFLEGYCKEFFLYIKSTYGSLSLETIKALFFKEFTSYKIMKIQELNSLIFDNESDLLVYVERKKALVDYVYPDSDDQFKIEQILSGLYNKNLIDALSTFSKYADFIEGVKINNTLLALEKDKEERLEKQEMDLFNEYVANEENVEETETNVNAKEAPRSFLQTTFAKIFYKS